MRQSDFDSRRMAPSGLARTRSWRTAGTVFVDGEVHGFHLDSCRTRIMEVSANTLELLGLRKDAENV